MRDTIDMAREAGLFVARENPRYYGASLDSLKAFEALVRADERDRPAPDYAWPTVADYEKDVGFTVNDTFKAAWNMARTTNDLFRQMGNT